MATESYIRTQDHLTISFSDGETTTVYPSKPQYKDIVTALAEKNYSKARKLAVPVAAVKAKIAKAIHRGEGNVELKNGIVYFNGIEVHSTLTDRIISMANEGFDIGPMCKFLSNLQENPSYRAVTELYSFLEKGNLPITEDGCFLAYKRVRGDYTDCHTGKFDNSIGVVVEMPRNTVNEDPNQTCSQGLHFCSRDYLPHFGTDEGYRTMILKINPADVVAIPNDYNNTKGRCCRYEVIGELEHKNEAHLEGAFHPSENYEATEDDDVDYDVPEDDDVDEDYDSETDSDLHSIQNSARELTFTIEAIEPTDGEVVRKFSSIKLAADWAEITPSAIRRVLKGERKTTGGYIWKQKNDLLSNKVNEDYADFYDSGYSEEDDEDLY